MVLDAERRFSVLFGVHQRHSEGIGDVLLRERKLDGAAADEAKFFGANEKMHQQIGHALKRVAAADIHQALVEILFAACSDPGYVTGQLRIVREKIPQLLAWKNAKRHVRQCLDRMLHLIGDRTLQAEKIRRQGEIQNLPLTIRQHFVTECPASQHRVEMRAVRALQQDIGAGFDIEFAGFEIADECQFLGRELTQNRPPAQRTFLARNAPPLRQDRLSAADRFGAL